MTEERLNSLRQCSRMSVNSLSDCELSKTIERASTCNHSKDTAQENWTKRLIELMLSKKHESSMLKNPATGAGLQSGNR